MQMLVAGIRDGRSAVVNRVEWTHDPDATDLSATRVIDLQVGAPDIRPIGSSDYRDYGIPVGTARWNRVRFPPGQIREMHYSNTLDSITVIDGTLWLILDDGEHQLVAGDCMVLNGVDHGWRVGPEGCITSNLLFGIPSR